MRAFKFLQKVPESPVSEHYRISVRQYLYQMAYFLQTYTSTSQDSIQAFIPEEVLNAGPQPPPANELASAVRQKYLSSLLNLFATLVFPLKGLGHSAVEVINEFQNALA